MAVFKQLSISSSINSSDITKIAGEDISTGNVVILSSDNKVYKADKDTSDHAKKILGVCVSGISLGDNAKIRIEGELNGLSGMTPGEVLWLSNSGAITHDASTTGFLVKIGYSVTETIMVIDIEEPIYRI